MCRSCSLRPWYGSNFLGLLVRLCLSNFEQYAETSLVHKRRALDARALLDFAAVVVVLVGLFLQFKKLNIFKLNFKLKKKLSTLKNRKMTVAKLFSYYYIVLY